MLPVGEGVAQAVRAPVLHVVVGQHAAVDGGGLKQRQVARVQAVVNALGGGSAARGDGAFQVDQPQVGALAGQALGFHPAR